MRIDEVEQTLNPSQSGSLMGLVDFLANRAKDTNGPQQIDQNTFIELAKDLADVTLSPAQLPDIISKPPLSNLFEPVDPNSDKLLFKGAAQPDLGMPVNKAQDVVAKAAKSAMKRGMK
jgi:hypothetical protein